MRFKVQGLRSRIQSSGLRVYSLRFGAVSCDTQAPGARGNLAGRLEQARPVRARMLHHRDQSRNWIQS